MNRHPFGLFESIPWGVGALLLILCFIGLACMGVLVSRKFVNPKTVKGHHDVAAVVFANLGVLYSVLIGFIVVNVQQRFDKIKDNTQVEASYLVELFRDAEVFDKKDREAIRAALVEYSRKVIKVEWPEMARGVKNDDFNDHLTEVWNAYYAVNASSEKQEQWYDLSINKLNLLMNARLSRLLGSHESLRAEMWAILFIGAFALAAFLCFFSLESLVSHLLMAAILAGVTGFLLFLIYSLDTAFSGDLRISPKAMEGSLRFFEMSQASHSTLQNF